MSIIITKGRFEGEPRSYTSLSDIADLENFSGNLDVPSDTDPAKLTFHAERFEAIRVAFPTSHDGRGFSIAKALRNAGYTGQLRACGNVLADQYPLAVLSGFDDVEIPEEQAKRQPEAQWSDAFARIENGYLNRLKTTAILPHSAAASSQPTA